MSPEKSLKAAEPHDAKLRRRVQTVPLTDLTGAALDRHFDKRPELACIRTWFTWFRSIVWWQRAACSLRSSTGAMSITSVTCTTDRPKYHRSKQPCGARPAVARRRLMIVGWSRKMERVSEALAARPARTGVC